MSRGPGKDSVVRGGAKAVGQTIERAWDPLASVIKKASGQKEGPAQTTSPGKPGLAISPLAVPFPKMKAVAGVEVAVAQAGFYKHDRPDLVVFRFAEGTTAAGVFTRHQIGSAPVDWCKRHLDGAGGEEVRA